MGLTVPSGLSFAARMDPALKCRAILTLSLRDCIFEWLFHRKQRRTRQSVMGVDHQALNPS